MRDEHQKQPGSWIVRRRFMFVITAFCMGTIVFCLWDGRDTEVAQVAVSMAFIIIGTTIASYVFGAAWQDIHMPFNQNRRDRGGYWGGYGEHYDPWAPRTSVYGMEVEKDKE